MEKLLKTIQNGFMAICNIILLPFELIMKAVMVISLFLSKIYVDVPLFFVVILLKDYKDQNGRYGNFFIYVKAFIADPEAKMNIIACILFAVGFALIMKIIRKHVFNSLFTEIYYLRGNTRMTIDENNKRMDEMELFERNKRLADRGSNAVKEFKKSSNYIER
ncbi:MAG: hypothetical protein K6G10_01370 [Butyrivibrio sp.]|nr:hypothetical protein [Butyrivibrio sp.]